MRLVLVEDDPLQEESIQETLESELDAEVTCIQTERDFMLRLHDLVVLPPDAVIMDVMMRWTDPEPGMAPAPSEVTDVMGGVRCLRALRQHPATAGVPVVLYTVLEKQDLEGYGLDDEDAVTWQRKGDPQALVDEIKRVTG